jgi:hypothetical protein
VRSVRDTSLHVGLLPRGVHFSAPASDGEAPNLQSKTSSAEVSTQKKFEIEKGRAETQIRPRTPNYVKGRPQTVP